MAYDCRIERDSISERGHRVTTMVVTMPRIVLAEFNTHRVFSRNSASSRAIPTHTQLRKLIDDAFVPVEFGTVDSGMNAGPSLQGAQQDEAREIWAQAQLHAIESALMLMTSRDYITQEWDRWINSQDGDYAAFVLSLASKLANKDPEILSEKMLRVSKGQTNRLLEPFMWHELIVTATEWQNFFNLRSDKNAQLEIRTASDLMKAAYDKSTPQLVQENEWHLPFIQPDEEEWAKQFPRKAVKSSMARCARVSYLTHDTKVIDYAKDEKLASGLSANGHMSPAEHPCYPIPEVEWELRSKMADTALTGVLDVPPHVIDGLVASTQFALNMRGWAPLRRDIRSQAVFNATA